MFNFGYPVPTVSAQKSNHSAVCRQLNQYLTKLRILRVTCSFLIALIRVVLLDIGSINAQIRFLCGLCILFYLEFALSGSYVILRYR